jgi:hypothetical protein
LPVTLPVTLAPFRHDTAIESVPSNDDPDWVNVTEKSPEPPPFGEYDPFHLPSTVDEVLPSPPEGCDEVGGGVLVLDVSVAAGGVLVVVLDELEHAARSTPHTMIAPLIRKLAARFIPSSLRPFP